MNTFIFQLFAICFLAYYCQGTEKEETKGKDKEKNTPAPSKVEKKPKKPDGAKIAYNAESSNAAEKPQNKKVKLCFEKADTNFKLIALHGKESKASLSTTVQESRIMNDREIILQCVEIKKKDIWDKLDEKEVITFKTDKMFRKKVLGSATVGTLKFVYESAERDEHPMCLDFTAERRDYYHFQEKKKGWWIYVPTAIILYKTNGTVFVFFKNVTLTFKPEAPFTVQAFSDKNAELLYSAETKRDGARNQFVTMSVDQEQWKGLDDDEKIIFKNGEGKVLGSATAQLLLKSSDYWLVFEDNKNYYYSKDNDGVYYNCVDAKFVNGVDINPGEHRWSSAKLLF